jgi:hypothetical protein
MSLPNPKKKILNGCWFADNSGKIWWKEFTSTYGETFELIEPCQIEGIERCVSFKLLYLRELTDENSLSGSRKLWFAQDVEVKINDNVSENIVLRYEKGSRKWYLSSLDMLGQTFVCPLESDDVITVTKGESYRVTAEQAKEILKVSGHAYGKVVIRDGSLELYRTV